MLTTMGKKDSGYAWFVVFCSFMLHFITDGVSYTFGIFFSALLEEFKSSTASGAWVPSIMTGITFGIGPIASVLTNKYGCRYITITGTSLAAMGFFFSTFAPNFLTLYFTIGILAGAGFGLIYLPAIVIITQYFSVHLALATGLAVSASGIGSSLFAPITEYLIQNFGWRYAMLSISLILLTSGLFGLSFKTFENESENSNSNDSRYDINDEFYKQKLNNFNREELCYDGKKELNSKTDKKIDTQINQDCVSINEKLSSSKTNINDDCSNKGNLIENCDLRKDLQENERIKLISKKIKDSIGLNFDKESQINNHHLNNSNKTNEKNHQKLKNAFQNASRSFDKENPRLSLDSSSNNSLQNQIQNHFLKEQLKEGNLNKIDLENDIILKKQFLNFSILHKSNCDLNTNQNKQIQYKSFNNLHHQNNLSVNYSNNLNSNTMNNNSLGNLNTIVLYSTSMTSINYCCANENLKEDQNFCKHDSTNQLNNLSTPLQLENGSLSKKSQIVVKNNSRKDSIRPYIKTQRRRTLRKIINISKYLKILLSWNILKDKIFLWFAISNFLTSLGYYVPHIYIKERCLNVPELANLSTECSYLFSYIGFSSTVGRILFGFLSNFEKCNRLYIYAHCLTLCGLSTILTVFANNYLSLAIYCIIFGLTTGAFVSLTSVILVDLLGSDRLSNAFGLLLLFQGVASLTGPPIVGWLYDMTSLYNPGFVFIGISIVISGIMLYFVPCIKQKI